VRIDQTWLCAHIVKAFLLQYIKFLSHQPGVPLRVRLLRALAKNASRFRPLRALRILHAEEGVAPEKPYSGKFNLRLSPELHRDELLKLSIAPVKGIILPYLRLN